MNKESVSRIHSKNKQIEISNMRAISFFQRFFIENKESLYYNKSIFIHCQRKSLTINFRAIIASTHHSNHKKDMDSTILSTYNSKLILPNTKKSSHGSSISNRVCIIMIMKRLIVECLFF